MRVPVYFLFWGEGLQVLSVSDSAQLSIKTLRGPLRFNSNPPPKTAIRIDRVYSDQIKLAQNPT